MKYIEIRTPDKVMALEIKRLMADIDWLRVMRTVSGVLLGIVDDNFTKGGRPEKWKPLNPLYKQDKIADGYSPDPLTRTAALRKSLQQSSSDTHATVTTNKVYAAIHHYGGAIKPKKGKALMFSMAGQNFAVKQVNMPARPYMVVPDDEIEAIDSVFVDVIKKHLGTSKTG